MYTRTGVKVLHDVDGNVCWEELWYVFPASVSSEDAVRRAGFAGAWVRRSRSRVLVKVLVT